MSVFTTRSLLHSVGIVGKGSASSAVAVNWVLKVSYILIAVMFFPLSIFLFLRGILINIIQKITLNSMIALKKKDL